MKNFKTFAITLAFLILFVSEILAEYISFFAYADEFLAVFALIVLLLRRKGNKKCDPLVKYIVILLTIGFLSNIMSNLNTLAEPALVDAFSIIKAFVVFIMFRSYVDRSGDYKKAGKYLTLFAKLFVVVAAVFLVLDQIGLVNMYERVRFGLREYRFIFKNAGTFSYYVMAIIPFLEKDKRDKNYKYLALLLMALTLKGPSLIFVVLYIYFTLKTNHEAWFKKYKKIVVPIALVGLVGASGYQLGSYIFNTTSARYILTEKSVVTAQKYFPFGSGFATYGSEMSRRYYSPLYYEYGFDKVYGLGKDHTAYINDNYWQMVLAQLGIVGFFVMIMMMTHFTKRIIKDTEKTDHNIWAKCMIICFLVGGIGSAYMTGCAFVMNLFAYCLVSRNKT